MLVHRRAVAPDHLLGLPAPLSILATTYVSSLTLTLSLTLSHSFSFSVIANDYGFIVPSSFGHLLGPSASPPAAADTELHKKPYQAVSEVAQPSSADDAIIDVGYLSADPVHGDTDDDRIAVQPSKPTAKVSPLLGIDSELETDADDDDTLEDDGETVMSSSSPTLGTRAADGIKAATSRVLGALPILILFALRQSYLVSLAALYICGLTAATVLNGVYVGFLIVFLISDTLAFKYWILLVLYTETVILAFIAWQVAPLSWDANTVVQVIGLQHSQGLLVDLVGWHIVILLFSLIQLIINTRMSNRPVAPVLDQLQVHPTLQLSIASLSAVVKRYAVAWPIRVVPCACSRADIRSQSHRMFLLVVYLILFLASVYDDTPTSLFTFAYLAILVVCLLLHHMFESAIKLLRLVWLFVVIGCAAILVIRYAYQFDALASLLIDVWPNNKWISLEAIGFRQFGRSFLFIPLLGNTLVFVATAFQLRIFLHWNTEDEAIDGQPSLEEMDRMDAERTRLLAGGNTPKVGRSSAVSYGSCPNTAAPGVSVVVTKTGVIVMPPDSTATSTTSTTTTSTTSTIPVEPPMTPSRAPVLSPSSAGTSWSELEQRAMVLDPLHRWPPMRELGSFCKRALMLHSHKLTLLVVCLVCLGTVCAINLVYAVLLMCCMLAPHGFDTVGLPVAVYSSALAVMQYFFHFNGFQEVVELVLPTTTSYSWWSWIGFQPPQLGFTLPNAVAPPTAILVALVIQRLATRWLLEYQKRAHNGDAPYGYPPPLFLVLKHEFMNKGWTLECVVLRIKYFLSNWYSIHGFWVFVGALLLNTFIRNNVWGIVQLSVAALAIVRPHNIRRVLFIIVFGLMVTFVLQYLMLLSFPDVVWSFPWDTWAPNKQSWLALGGFNPYQLVGDFLCILTATLILFEEHYDRSHHRTPSTLERLLSDADDAAASASESEHRPPSVIASTSLPGTPDFLLSDTDGENELPTMVERAYQFSGPPAPPAFGGVPAATTVPAPEHHEVVIEPPSLVDIADDDGIGEPPTVGRTATMARMDELQKAAKKNFQYIVQRKLMRFSQHIILLFVFVVGTAQQNILSAGYVILSLYFLYYDRSLVIQGNQLWRRARVYNYLVLWIKMLYQCAWIPDVPDSMWRQAIGVSKFHDLSAFSSSGVLFDLIIFLLLSLQAVVFDMPKFRAVIQQIDREQRLVADHVKRRYQEYLKREQRLLEIMERERRERAARVELIKQFRQNKAYLRADADVSLYLSQASAKIASQNQLKQQQEHGVAIAAASPAVPSTSKPAISDPVEAALHAQEPDLVLPETMFSTTVGPDLPEIDDVRASEAFGTDEDGRPLGDAGSSSTTTSGAATTPGPATTTTHEATEVVETSVAVAPAQEEEENWFAKGTRFMFRYTAMFLYYMASEPLPDLSEYRGHAERARFLLVALGQLLATTTYVWCFLAMIVNQIAYANLISLVYPVAVFAYGLFESPRPTKQFWRAILLYANVVLVTKFLFQLSIFCMCYYSSNDYNLYYWNYAGWCSTCVDTPPNTIMYSDLPSFFGVVKMQTHLFLRAVFWDVVVLVTVLAHRHILKKTGMWRFLSELQDERRLAFRIEQERLRVEKARERRQKKLKKKHHSKTHEGKHEQHNTDKKRDSTSVFEVSSVSSSAPSYHGSAVLRKRLSGAVKRGPAASTYRDYASDSSDCTIAHQRPKVGFFTRIKRSISGSIKAIRGIPFELKFYFSSLLCEKNSRKDYYMVLFIIETIVFGFLVLFQSAFTSYPNTEWTLFLLESRIPESFFYILLTQFFLILIDRVIYLYRSVRAKVLTQLITGMSR